jgi:hypothetical protein
MLFYLSRERCLLKIRFRQNAINSTNFSSCSRNMTNRIFIRRMISLLIILQSDWSVSVKYAFVQPKYVFIHSFCPSTEPARNSSIASDRNKTEANRERLRFPLHHRLPSPPRTITFPPPTPAIRDPSQQPCGAARLLPTERIRAHRPPYIHVCLLPLFHSPRAALGASLPVAMDLRLKLLAETHRRERRRPSRPTQISEAKKLTGLVVTMKADRTVGVEVVRLARHPKCHRRDCIKKAHDPGNRFKPSGLATSWSSSTPAQSPRPITTLPSPPRRGTPSIRTSCFPTRV